MRNLTSSLLANAYSSFYPGINLANSWCTVNGQSVPCRGPFFGFFLGFGIVFAILAMALVVLMVVSMWKVFEKAGQKGWKSIIPIYNYIIMLRIVKKPEWLVFFMFVPVASLVLAFIIFYNMAKAFSKGIGFAFGMTFLPFIFFPILAFRDAKYTIPLESHSTIL